MTDPTSYPESSQGAGTGAASGSPPPMPRWVRALLVVVAVLVLLVIIVKLSGLGDSGHGPGRHTGMGHSSEVLVGRR